MTDTAFLQNIIVDELSEPSVEMTRQYLRILEVEQKDGLPHILKIDRNEDHYLVYVKVKNERFQLTFRIDSLKGEIIGVDDSPEVFVHYTASSDRLSLADLKQLTRLAPTDTEQKGDSYSLGNDNEIHKYNSVTFRSYNEPGTIEHKIETLLSYLASDADGIKALVRETGDNDVWVTISYHNSTGIFTGLSLNNGLITKLAELQLDLVFDIYAVGKPFIQEDRQ